MPQVAGPSHLVDANFAVDPKMFPTNKMWGQRFHTDIGENYAMDTLSLRMENMARQHDRSVLPNQSEYVHSADALANVTANVYEYNTGIATWYSRQDFLNLQLPANGGFAFSLVTRGITGSTAPRFDLVFSDLNGGSGETRTCRVNLFNTTNHARIVYFHTVSAWDGVRVEIQNVVSTSGHVNGQDIFFYDPAQVSFTNYYVKDLDWDYDDVRIGVLLLDSDGNLIDQSDEIAFDTIPTAPTMVDFTFGRRQLLDEDSDYIFQLYANRSPADDWGDWSRSYGSTNDGSGVAGIPSYAYTVPLPGNPRNYLDGQFGTIPPGSPLRHALSSNMSHSTSPRYGTFIGLVDKGPAEHTVTFLNTVTLNVKAILWGTDTTTFTGATEFIPVKPSQQYTFSIWMYGSPGTHNVLWPMALSVLKDGGATVIGTTAVSILESWNIYSITFTTDANTTAVMFSLAMNNTVNALSSDAAVLYYAPCLVEGASPAVNENHNFQRTDASVPGGRYGVMIHATSAQRSAPAGAYADGNIQTRSSVVTWADDLSDQISTNPGDLIFEVTYNTEILEDQTFNFTWDCGCSDQPTAMNEILAQIEAASEVWQTQLSPSIQINQGVEPNYGSFATAWINQGHDLPIPERTRFTWVTEDGYAGEYMMIQGAVHRLENELYSHRTILVAPDDIEAEISSNISTSPTSADRYRWRGLSIPRRAKLYVATAGMLGEVDSHGSAATGAKYFWKYNLVPTTTTVPTAPADHALATSHPSGTQPVAVQNTFKYYLGEVTVPGVYDVYVYFQAAAIATSDASGTPHQQPVRKDNPATLDINEERPVPVSLFLEVVYGEEL